MKRIVLVLFWVSITFSIACSQNYFFDNYSVESGLGNSKVYTVIQDKSHLIWMGTPSGVSTFDGLTFKNFTSEQGLAENGVWTVYQDSHGNIWFGHYDGGISRWNGKIFESIPGNVIFNKDVHSFCENSKGELWITTEGSGAALVSNPDAPLKELRYERFKGKRLSDIVYGCILLSDKRNYFITDAGLKVFNTKNKNFETFYIQGMPRFFQITVFFEDSKQNLWIGTFHGGLYYYNKSAGTFKIYDVRDGLSSNWVRSIIEDKTGNIWVGSQGGVTRIDGQNLRIFNQKNGLPADNIYCLTQDAENNILIGTSGRGLSIYKGEILEFSQTPDVLPNHQVWSLMEDRQHRIWFGTNAGLSIYNQHAASGSKFTILGDGLGKPSQVRFLKEDASGTVWIGTEDNGIFQYNPKTERFTASVDIYSQLDNTQKITCMDIDRQGNLWIGALDRLLKYNIKNKQIKGYSQYDGLIGSSISAIYIDSDNTKYIGSQGKGLTVFKDSLSTHSIKYPLLENTTPSCITSDKRGTLWIGTKGQGLLKFRNGIIEKRFQEKDGLLADLINFVGIDNNNDVYVGTNRGLNKIEPATGIIKTFTRRNGFTGIEALNNSILKDSENNWWFGTVNGAVRFDKNTTLSIIKEPLTHISRFTVNQTNHALNDGAHLNYLENAISFEYNSICLNNPEAVAYQVMLVGADKNWQPVTKQTSVMYQALPPGSYTFKVKAKNSAGYWNQNPARFNFVIAPPFYTTWWFISLSIFFSLLSIFLYVKLRERKLIIEKKVLEEKVEIRTTEVVNMNKELEMKNKDIVDSILYARRIQNALLPPDLPFDNTFVFFLPKDIVSGDFFWFTTNGNKEWFAAVDCTGHGVPGAFMSIIGHSLLNKIVNEMGIRKPSDILDKLNAEVSTTLHQYHYDNQIHDGMDIALVSYDRQSHMISYAGAFNPLWIVRNNELLETRANRYSIGMAPGMEKMFVNTDIHLEPEDTLYLFSDGFADQFGGPFNKKLKISAFKELVLNLQKFPMDEQRNQLQRFYYNWKKDNEQVDDILVIGRKFTF